jgi:opacity protein-like surface antigen
MSRMNKTTHTFVALAVGLLTSTLPLCAMPLGSNEPSDYLIKGQDLSKLTMGIYAGQHKRQITWDDSGFTEVMESDRVQAYLGYDVLDWLTVYAIGGANESNTEGTEGGDSESELGLGFRVNVLNHFIREPVPAEDIIRMNMGVEYVRSSFDNGFASSDWGEFSVALTVALVNTIDGNKYFWPESIAIYAGPIYSAINGDEFEADDTVGVIGGLELYLTDTITLDLQVKYFNETSVAGGVNFRF